ERLDRDEPSTANLDGLELPSGNELVGAGAAEPPTVLIAIRVVHVGLHHATSQAADIGWQRTYFHRCSQFTSTACGSCISDGLKRAYLLRFKIGEFISGLKQGAVVPFFFFETFLPQKYSTSSSVRQQKTTKVFFGKRKGEPRHSLSCRRIGDSFRT